MEYLTIQEPRSSHFLGMEHHQTDILGTRSRDDFSRQARPSVLERGRSPSYFQQMDPGLSKGWHQPSRSTNINGSFEYSRQPTENSVAPISTVTRPAASSIAALLQPTEEAPFEPTKQEPPDRNRLVQHGSVPPTEHRAHEPKRNDEQQPLKLPSFTSLVEQLERDSELTGASRSYPAGTEPVWKRHEPTASISRFEPLAFQFGGRGSSGRHNISNSSAHQTAFSEPASPHAYSSNPVPHRHPLSPRSRAQSPRLNHPVHVRRVSENQSRALSQLSASVSYDLHAPAVFASSHQRTQTLPSYPAVPHAPEFKGSMFQHHLPPQGLGPEVLPLPTVAGGVLRHPHIAPAPPAHVMGHTRNDSVMNTTEESRFYSNAFPATSTGSSNHARKRRGNLPKEATRVLRQWFDEHLEAPYPGEEVKNDLCRRTNLQMSQVNNWFINARRRLPRQDRTRKERESTDMSEDSPSRDRLSKQRCPADFWS